MKHSNRFLISGFALIILLMLTLTSFSYQLTRNTHQHMKQLVNTQYHKLNLIMNMQIYSRQRTVDLQNMLLHTDPFELDQSWLNFTLSAGRYIEYRLELIDLSNPVEREEIKAHDRLANRLANIQNEIAEDILSGHKHQANERLMKEALPLANQFLDQIKQMAQTQQTLTQQTLVETETNYAQTLTKMLLIGFFSMLIVIGIGYFIFKRLKTFNLKLKNISKSLENRVKKRTQELERLSSLDPLTQLYNRLKIDQSLKKVWQDYRCRLVPFGVLFIDIDHFKQINDQHGHDIGDTVLKELAEILRNNFRHSDYYGRWGGEEFLAICTSIDQASLTKIAEELRQKIQSHTFTCQIPITISIGTALIDESDNIATLTKRADQALYLAKSAGRNRVISG